MNYRTIEKIKIVVGLSAMAIIVAAWLYPVFFLMVNANKTASEYSQGSKTEIIWGTSIFENAIKAWNKGIGDGVFNSLLYVLFFSSLQLLYKYIAIFRPLSGDTFCEALIILFKSYIIFWFTNSKSICIING